MQYGRALERYLCNILLADPRFGPVYMMKCDMADGYYRLNLVISDIPRLAVSFPSEQHDEPLIALPLVLPMGWKNSGPAFCAAIETIADMTNKVISEGNPQPSHPLETIAQNMDHHSKPPTIASLAAHQPGVIPLRSPFLHRPTPKQAAYVDIFVDDFIALVQGYPQQLARVRRALFHNIDLVFRPLDAEDNKHRGQPISLKKYLKEIAHGV